MRNVRPLRQWLVLLSLAAAFIGLACNSGNSKGPPATSTAVTSATAAASGPITLQIVSPANGAAVTNPFTLKVQATGAQIADWSQHVSGAAHFDAFLDKSPVAEGNVAPSGQGIFHFAGSVQVEAAQGRHKITVVLSDNEHVRLKGAPTAEVTFTIGLPPTP